MSFIIRFIQSKNMFYPQISQIFKSSFNLRSSATASAIAVVEGAKHLSQRAIGYKSADSCSVIVEIV